MSGGREGGEEKQGATVSSEGLGAVFENNWLLVAVLSLIYTCAFVDRYVISLLAQPIKIDLGLSDVQLSIILGLAFSLFYGLFNLPAGFLIDRFGRRGILASTSFGWSLTTVFAGFSTSFGQLFAGRAVVGITEAFVTPTSFSLIRDRVTIARRARAFSILAMAPYIGSAIAYSGGAAILAHAEAGGFAEVPILAGLHPWQSVLVCLGLAGLPMPLLLLLLRKDRRTFALAASPAVGPGVRAAWTHIRTQGAVYALLIAYVTLGAALNFGRGDWLPVIMARKFELSPSAIGYVAGPVALISGVAGLWASGWLLDKLTLRGANILIFAMGAMALGATFSALAPQMSRPALSWACYSMAFAFSSPTFSVGAILLSRITPSAVMGRITAVYLLFQSVVGAALGPMLVALFAKLFPSSQLAIVDAMSLYCCVAGLSTIIVLIMLNRRLKSDPATAQRA